MKEQPTPEQETPNPTSTSKEFLHKWSDRLYAPIFALSTGFSGVQTGLNAAHGDEMGTILYGTGTVLLVQY